jgi:DUF1680 family protein
MERVFYNTVLGTKTLQPDGRAFYYSDYHFGATKTYFPDRWPCCSGTLPQVTADYRLLPYFHDEAGIYVNLYLPSTVRWTSVSGGQVELTQSGDYPFGERTTIHLKTLSTSAFDLRLRIPAWTTPKIQINGASVPVHLEKGFAILRRKWSSDDQIELDLPMRMKLESIDTRHPETVALVRGSLVLFAIGEKIPSIAKQQLLAATRLPGTQTWKAESASGPVTLKPFLAIEDEHYNTYIRCSS